MGKSKQKTTSGPGQERTQQSRDIYRAAQEAGGQVPTSVQGALDFFSGQPGAGQQFMNPYQQQVIDRMNEQFGVQNQMTTNMLNDQATRAGAFGGSRHGVAQGVALGENARNQGMQIAGLLNQGFEGAGERAMAAANLGMTAGNPALWRMNILKQGVAGQPYKTVSHGSRTGIGVKVPLPGGGELGPY